MTTEQFDAYKFMIGEKPFCYWNWGLKEKTRQFLETVDTEYFAYIADSHNNTLNDEKNNLRAALAIRTAYAQALEAFFAFLCAAIQAPYGIPVWLAKYQNKDLDNLVRKISHHEPIYSSRGHIALSWLQIVAIVHENLILSDKEKEQMVKSAFADLWARFAQDFTNDKASKEYNSIKHGFRVKAGGFTLALGLEETPGTPAPLDKMHLIGTSTFGSSFPIVDSISQDKDYKHHVYIKRCSINWDPEDMLYGLHIISLSLNNIVSYLRIKNGANAEDVVFNWLPDNDTYTRPWKNRNTLGVHSMTWTEGVIHEDMIEKFTKNDIKALYGKKPDHSPE